MARLCYFYGIIASNMYQPKYSISDKILKNIAEIEEIRTRISDSYILPTREAEMRYRATVEATHSSTSIEGNPLNAEQIKAVLSGKPLLVRNEYAKIEVKNYKKALDYISKYNLSTITADTILTVHKILTKRLLDETRSGKWRKNPVYIEDQDGNTVYTAVEAKYVSEKINDLISWLHVNTLNIHPVIIAALLHHELVTIHPFADGNGRTARIITALFLKTALYDFRSSLVLDSYYSTDRPAYYQALHNTQGPTFNSTRQFDLSAWLEYFVEGFLVSAKVLETEVKLLSSAIQPNKFKTKLSRDEIDLISYVSQFGSIDISEAMGILPNISRRTIQRILKNLVDDNIFISVGNAKGTKYHIKI